MDANVMVHKANAIAQYFAAYPAEEAVAGVTEHLQKFWPVRMRRQLLEYLSAGGEGLHPLVVEAGERITGGDRVTGCPEVAAG